MDAKADHFSSEAVDTVAMTLQDAHYGVDVVNEHILRSGATEYRVLVVPDTQREVAPETFVAIVDFVRDGGKLAVLGNSLLTVEGVADPIESLRRLHGDATCAGSVTIADVPSQLLYPKAGGVLVGVMDRLQVTPDVTITSGGEDRHLVFSQRGRDDRLLLHVVDLTSHADGRQLPPNDKNNATDPVEAIPTLRLKMRLATAPNDVAIWPTDSRVKHAWRDGVLELTLRNVETHAVVDISLPIPEASP